MRRRLSQGVRIYLHVNIEDEEGSRTLRTRSCYNHQHGIKELSELLLYPWRIVAVGSEGGAMVAHLLWTD